MKNLLILNKILKKWQSIVFVGLSFSLALPITIAWVCLGIGIGIEILIALTNTNFSYFKLYLKPLAKHPLFYPILSFGLINFFSGWLNGGISEGIYSFFSLKAMLILFYVLIVIRRYRPIKSVIFTSLIISGSMSALAGIMQQLFDWHFTKFKYLQATGLNTTPMNFAGEMQIYASFAIMLLFNKNYAKLGKFFDKKIIIIALSAICLLGLLCSCERSAIIGFSVATAVFIFMFYKNKLRLFMFIILAISINLIIPNLRLRLFSLWHWQNDVSVLVRLKVYLIALSKFLTSPLYGIGPRFFPHIYFPQIFVPYHESYLHHAHSNYLQILATLGIIGLIVYLWLMFSIFKTCFRQKTDGVKLGIALATLSLMVSGLFEYNFGSGQIRLLQMFMYGLL